MAVLETPIDETVLNGLGQLKQHDFALKIVKLYLDTTPSMLKELESAALADDLRWLRVANHNLNSTSTAVGRYGSLPAAMNLDRTLRTGPVGNAQDWPRIIAEEYHQAEAALPSWCTCQLAGPDAR